MNHLPKPLFDSFGILPQDFEQSLRARLLQRLEQDPEYSSDEIARVSDCSPKICDREFALKKDEYERLRVLCILSQCTMSDSSKINSHRKFIGPIIVKAKRILWKIISSQLENTFSGIQEFSSWMLVSHIKTIEKVQKLEDKTD